MRGFNSTEVWFHIAHSTSWRNKDNSAIFDCLSPTNCWKVWIFFRPLPHSKTHKIQDISGFLNFPFHRVQWSKFCTKDVGEKIQDLGAEAPPELEPGLPQLEPGQGCSARVRKVLLGRFGSSLQEWYQSVSSAFHTFSSALDVPQRFMKGLLDQEAPKTSG